ncbi:MAG: 3-oxoadipate enol-lactonase [Bacteroidia bacterium]|nr:MAG: 3-oxoadipate enol-lactonase [Bacteroidia bacterium]
MYAKTKDGLNIYYEIKGKPDAAESIIFLNGLSQATVSWYFMLPCFEEKYRLILMDFIFQGQSDKTGEWRTFDQHAKDVLAVLNATNTKKAIVIGISYGSLVAQHLAVNHPECVSKLILLSTFAHKTPYFEVIEHAWWNALEIGGYPLMFDIMLPNVLSEEYFKKPLIPVDTLRKIRQESNQSKEALFKLMTATKNRGDYRNELKKIKAPTLVIHGEKDTLITLSMGIEVANHIPNAVMKIIPNAGHTLNMEKINEVCVEILKFLNG